LLSKRSIRVETLLSPGDPAKGILAAARSKDADLIALGTHGRRGTDRFFFGSVAESVLLGSEVPLLLRRTVRVSKWLGALAQGARQ
jgi:nucleotide-binding universal stress UspA family protein